MFNRHIPFSSCASIDVVIVTAEQLLKSYASMLDLNSNMNDDEWLSGLCLEN